MTELLLVRHGETLWNNQTRFQGHTDVPLSQRGWNEAQCLAERLAGERVTAIYSSDLTRARDTAEIVARRLDKPVNIDSRLKEMALGEWQGMTYAEVRRRYFGDVGPSVVYPIDNPPLGGESLRQLQVRLLDGINSIVARHSDERLVIVTHGACLRALACAWLDMELSRYWELPFDSGSVSEVHLSGERVMVSRLNDTTHLRMKELA